MNVLFLSFYFPPRYEISVNRTWNIAKELSKQGCGVTVITVDTTGSIKNQEEGYYKKEVEQLGIKVIRTGFFLKEIVPEFFSLENQSIFRYLMGGIVRRICRLIRYEIWWPWISAAVKAGKKISRDDVDIILVSAGPYISFQAAYHLSKFFSVPYVLDYRDLWTNNPIKQTNNKPWIISLEKKYIQHASAVVTVSKSHYESLYKKYNVQNRYYFVTNGFDSDYLKAIKPKTFTDFSIIFAGSLYEKMDLSPFLAALKNIYHSHPDLNWQFHYYGPSVELVKKYVQISDIENRVVIHGFVPRKEALAAVAGADVALVLISTERHATLEERGIITGKVFEIIGLKTEVMLVAPENSDAGGIIKGFGEHFVGDEHEKMKHFLINRMERTLKRESAPPTRYSWPELGKQYKALLEECL